MIPFIFQVLLIMIQNDSIFLAHKLQVTTRIVMESFPVDDNIKTSDIRVPTSSPPLVPAAPGNNRRQPSTSTKERYKRYQTPRSYSDQGYNYNYVC